MFQNAKDLVISMENSYTEGQCIDTLLENFR